MITPFFLNVTAAAGLAGILSPAAHPIRSDDIVVAQVVVRSHIVIRVQAARPAPLIPLRSLFREKKGPRCIATTQMVGAAVIAPNAVDIVLRGGSRLRARFAASCPALDYYSGFYLAPTPDGMLCAGRDVVRDRAGGECPIDKLKALELRKPPVLP